MIEITWNTENYQYFPIITIKIFLSPVSIFSKTLIIIRSENKQKRSEHWNIFSKPLEAAIELL